MEYSIAHELPGRLRLRCPGDFTSSEAWAIGEILNTQEYIKSAVFSPRTGSLLIHHDGDRRRVLEAVRVLDRSFYREIGDPEPGADADDGSDSFPRFFLGAAVRSMLPRPVRYAVNFLRALPLLGKGFFGLIRNRRLDVSVLDASAVGISMLRGDFQTAAVITTLLALGDLIERQTRKKSKARLADSLAVHVDKLWVRRNGSETQIPMGELLIGDMAVVRAGSVIPVDGVVAEGEGMVNQTVMTGESEAVRRIPGLSVFAGTVVEEGELVVRVTAFENKTRICKIAEMIEESEYLKAEIQNRAERVADAIVPVSFLLAAAVYLFTRDAARAAAALMADYSCAVKLTTPLTVLSAMREGAGRGMLIKGGRFLETLASANTVVFDKTGTLTVSTPVVAKVVPFGGYERDEALRTAACLEEHFPHSVARAVVRQAEIEGLSHREKHSTVEYMVAHGIVSRIGDDRLLIGSAHFIFDDEGIVCTPEQREIIDRESGRYSVLYLTVGDRLAALICVEDPLRDDARATVNMLHEAGVAKVVMLTGDNAGVAGNAARYLGIDEFHAGLLPEDKTRMIKEMKACAGPVVMVGDGINDSPALSAADVGIAMRSGADIAREVADVVLTENRLAGIVEARRLGEGMMRKIHRGYSYIIGVNSLLLVLGVTGVITPAFSALLHNLSTLVSSVYSLTPVLNGPAWRPGTGRHGKDEGEGN
ncbi:MAG: heavy metal translocating P-type ATPase [Synergistaceae bacterium]|jgi:Cu2+-exporting ATPase|nr:heavy metal translocating P-type ATPase [Synergistaceae bacterium]